ncbi:gonadotropin-releasing hormone receptor [Caerostris darwini]|uniref:Gonadotropin-releasing hormone receptor n=1 Tax=Caerostris darwini TaxID=1538125 RepID=A0AAV4VCV4_9ARAC|nr:gonadotropin-releasing hormone receptor [Caerostris darwini]
MALPLSRLQSLKMTSAILLSYVILNFPILYLENAYKDRWEKISENTLVLAYVTSLSHNALSPFICLAFQSKKTLIGRCLKILITIVRSRQWSSANVWSLFGFSNDLSKLNVIVLPTAPHFQEAKVSAVTNGAIEVTCV